MRFYTIYKNCLSIVLRTALVYLVVAIVLCLLSAIFIGVLDGEPPKHAFMLWVERIFRWFGYLEIIIFLVYWVGYFFDREVCGLLACFSPRDFYQECKKIDWQKKDTSLYDEHGFHLGGGLMLVFLFGGIHTFWCQPYPCVRELFSRGIYKYILWGGIVIACINVLAQVSGYLMQELYIEDKCNDKTTLNNKDNK